MLQVNFCENGELEQNGVSSDSKTVCCEEVEKEKEESMKKEEEDEKEEKDLKELKKQEMVSRDIVREDSDSEEKTERCALIRRSQSNSPEGPERLV